MPRPTQADATAHINAIIAAALAAADPAVLVPAARLPPLFESGPLALLAVGKAATTMARALGPGLRSRVSRALIIAPPESAAPPTDLTNCTVLESDHPLPTDRSAAAGAAALDLAEHCARTSTPLLVLISGGASALMCLPEPGLTADDIAAVTISLLRSGASIDELNTVRIHCDRLKGGRLAAAAAPAPVHALILSDVPGDYPELVGSGPTIATATTPADALAILKRHRAISARSAITSHLRFLCHRPSPERDAPAAVATHTVIGSNALALAAATRAAAGLGFELAESQPVLTGEARDAAFALVASARTYRARTKGPFALLRGGETTVTVRNKKGRGGRNLEAALAAAIMIDGDPSLVVATFATDGIDGTSDAAGAIVSGITAAAARRAGSDPEDYLARNDSHRFFDKVGGGGGGGPIRRGRTGTNVNDVWIVLGY